MALPGARPPFDPRCDLRAELHDLGPVSVFSRDAGGVLSGPREERRRAMSVFLDGEERIERGLVFSGGSRLVACTPCSSCDLFECNLTENHAARVRRLGPYVLWVTVWGELRCFGLDRYREVFGGDVEALPGPTEDDCSELDEPARAGEYVGPDGRALWYDVDCAPDAPLARLSLLRSAGGLEAVEPPVEAIELRSAVAGAPSLWLDAHPRPDGRRAAFLPGVFLLPVWITGPAVDELVGAALGPPPAPASPAPSSPSDSARSVSPPWPGASHG